MLWSHIKNLYENKKGLQYSKPFFYDKQQKIIIFLLFFIIPFLHGRKKQIV